MLFVSNVQIEMNIPLVSRKKTSSLSENCDLNLSGLLT
jgi:hypothetical protein